MGFRLLRPGPGWTRLGGAVWEHNSGVRIHTGGQLVRTAAGRVLAYWTYSDDIHSHVKICGGNVKRGLMAWALSVTGQ